MEDIVLGLRRATESIWNREDAKADGFRLSDGEPGYDKTNHVIKIGDGISKFADLPAIGGGTEFDGGTINGNITILSTQPSGQKYFEIKYYDTNDYQEYNFRLSANNANQLMYLNSSNPSVGTILSANYSGTSINFYGNSNTATKLKTSRTISLTGAVTGSVSFDGSANVSLATTASSSLITTSSTTQYKSGNFYVNKKTGEADLGLVFDNGSGTEYSLYFFANNTSGNSGIYHSEKGTIIQVPKTGINTFSGDITGNAATATSAISANTITSTLPISKGGTGATDGNGARINFSVPCVLDDGNNYWGIYTPNAGLMTYLRVPGLLPWTSSAGGYIGTSSWKFDYVYAKYGYFDNIGSGNGWMRIGSYKICWGTMTVKYAATNASSNHYYGNSTSITGGSFASSFSSTPTSVILTIGAGTTSMYEAEVITVTASGITSLRIHRANSYTDNTGVKIYYVAYGAA